MLIVSAIPSLATDVLVLLTLLLVFAASWMTFHILCDRATYQRQSSALADWARDHRMRLHERPSEIPQPFDKLSGHGLGVRVLMSGKSQMILQLQPQDLAQVGPKATGYWPIESTAAAFKRLLASLVTRAPFLRRSPESRPGRAVPLHAWHVFMRQTSFSWSPTGLRPVANNRSMLDLFSLTSFPLLGATDRFVVYGTESQDAERLSRSMARGLLPPDIGILFYADRLLIDFSARPFDEIEFNRMLALAEQLEQHLRRA